MWQCSTARPRAYAGDSENRFSTGAVSDMYWYYTLWQPGYILTGMTGFSNIAGHQIRSQYNN